MAALLGILGRPTMFLFEKSTHAQVQTWGGALDRLDSPRMMREVITQEGRDEVIAVVVAGVAAQGQAGWPAARQACSSSSGRNCGARNSSASP